MKKQTTKFQLVKPDAQLSILLDLNDKSFFFNSRYTFFFLFYPRANAWLEMSHRFTFFLFLLLGHKIKFFLDCVIINIVNFFFFFLLFWMFLICKDIVWIYAQLLAEISLPLALPSSPSPCNSMPCFITSSCVVLVLSWQFVVLYLRLAVLD